MRHFVPGLSGIVVGKFGGRAFFDYRMSSNVNEQRRAITPAFLDQLYHKFWTGRPLHRATHADWQRVCTLAYAPHLVHPAFLDWRKNVSWHELRGTQRVERCDSHFPPPPDVASVASRTDRDTV